MFNQNSISVKINVYKSTTKMPKCDMPSYSVYEGCQQECSEIMGSHYFPDKNGQCSNRKV